MSNQPTEVVTKDDGKVSKAFAWFHATASQPYDTTQPGRCHLFHFGCQEISDEINYTFLIEFNDIKSLTGSNLF